MISSRTRVYIKRVLGVNPYFLERKYQIHVRPRCVDGEFTCIRASPNIFTTLEEVDLFAAAIKDAAVHGIGD